MTDIFFHSSPETETDSGTFPDDRSGVSETSGMEQSFSRDAVRHRTQPKHGKQRHKWHHTHDIKHVSSHYKDSSIRIESASQLHDMIMIWHRLLQKGLSSAD